MRRKNSDKSLEIRYGEVVDLRDGDPEQTEQTDDVPTTMDTVLEGDGD
ncbi:hypothetical protein [Mariniluteicoccus endophyticus]